jgi:hypothetical protein
MRSESKSQAESQFSPPLQPREMSARAPDALRSTFALFRECGLGTLSGVRGMLTNHGFVDPQRVYRWLDIDAN